MPSVRWKFLKKKPTTVNGNVSLRKRRISRLFEQSWVNFLGDFWEFLRFSLLFLILSKKRKVQSESNLKPSFSLWMHQDDQIIWRCMWSVIEALKRKSKKKPTWYRVRQAVVYLPAMYIVYGKYRIFKFENNIYGERNWGLNIEAGSWRRLPCYMKPTRLAIVIITIIKIIVVVINIVIITYNVVHPRYWPSTMVKVIKIVMLMINNETLWWWW